jgi:hypothetical protein
MQEKTLFQISGTRVLGILIPAVFSLLLVFSPSLLFAADFLTKGSASMNWSGYVAAGDDFSRVSGTWIVPEVTKDENDPYIMADAIWVGIGGVEGENLIQAGTQAIVEGNEVMYEAWFELLPSRSRTVHLLINPGDSVTVSIE